jgi:hypothetical protein
METITLKINERSKAGKLLKGLIETLSDQLDVEIIGEKSPYNAAFVKKVQKARAEKGGKTVTADNLWENIK